MKKYTLIYLSVSVILCLLNKTVDAQTLYAPGGTLGTSSNNNVGIGVAAPALLFDVRSGGVSTGGILGLTNSNGTKYIGMYNGANTNENQAIYWTTGQDLKLGVAPNYSAAGFSELVRIKSNGNLGIGTTSPGKLLTLYTTGAGISTLRLQNQYNAFDLEYVRDVSGSVDRLDFNPGAAGAKVSFINNGNVGIGTTNPTTPLQVKGDITLGSTTLGQRFLFHTRDWLGGDALIIAPDDATGSWLWDKGITLKRSTGNVGIGTGEPGSFKLAVEGKIGAREIKVTSVTPWPDYVFDKEYQLNSLEEVECFIKENKHLPNITSAKGVEINGGIDLGEMQVKHLEKTEELYLYIIELNKKIKYLELSLKEMEVKINR